jgi:hypothetical protein
MEVGTSDSTAGVQAQAGKRRRARKPQVQRDEVDIVFPREEAYIDELGGKKEDDSEESPSNAVNQPELVMKQLKFLNVLVTTPSVKKRVWIWRKMVPGITRNSTEWSKDGAAILIHKLLLSI